MILLLAWRNLWRNKARSFITMASVFFAVLLATSTRSLNEGTYDQMIENVAGMHTGYLQVQQVDYWDDKVLENTFVSEENLLRRIREIPGIDALAPRLESFVLVSTGNTTTPSLVVGIDPVSEQALTGLANNLVSGTYLQAGASDVLLAQGLAERLGLSPGDSLVLLGQGFRAASAAGLFRVGGIVRFGSPDLNDRMVYLTLETAQNLFAAEGRLTSLVIKPRDGRDVAKILETLRAGVGEEFRVLDWQEMLPGLVQAIAFDRAGGIIFMGVLYLVIAFGIFGTLVMMTFERRQEFGVLLSIGMRRGRMATMVFLETIGLAGIGVLAGMGGSLPLVLWFSRNPIQLTGSWAEAYRDFGLEPVLHVSTDVSVFTGQGLVILLVAILLSLFPVYTTLRLNPLEAMKR